AGTSPSQGKPVPPLLHHDLRQQHPDDLVLAEDLLRLVGELVPYLVLAGLRHQRDRRHTGQLADPCVLQQGHLGRDRCGVRRLAQLDREAHESVALRLGKVDRQIAQVDHLSGRGGRGHGRRGLAALAGLAAREDRELRPDPDQHHGEDDTDELALALLLHLALLGDHFSCHGGTPVLYGFVLVRMTTCTRRLAARPWGVASEASGWYWPYPAPESLVGSIP